MSGLSSPPPSPPFLSVCASRPPEPVLREDPRRDGDGGQQDGRRGEVGEDAADGGGGQRAVVPPQAGVGLGPGRAGRQQGGAQRRVAHGAEGVREQDDGVGQRGGGEDDGGGRRAVYPVDLAHRQQGAQGHLGPVHAFVGGGAVAVDEVLALQGFLRVAQPSDDAPPEVEEEGRAAQVEGEGEVAHLKLGQEVPGRGRHVQTAREIREEREVRSSTLL